VRKKGVRIGRHPVTGEKILISPRRVIKFKPSPILKRPLASMRPRNAQRKVKRNLTCPSSEILRQEAA
jgi:hypothetical protein